MTQDSNGPSQKSNPTVSSPPSPSSNRYILIAALAFAAVMAIYIIKTNLEPPKIEDVAATQSANSRIPDDAKSSEAQRDEIMHQIEHVHEILAKDSTDYGAWASLGNLYYDAGMHVEAIAHYRGALAINPNDLDVWTDLATMERARGRADTAVAILEHVLAADSMRAQAWFNLGVIQNFDLKNTRAALVAWKRFLVLTPESEHTEPVRKEIERLERELGS